MKRSKMLSIMGSEFVEFIKEYPEFDGMFSIHKIDSLNNKLLNALEQNGMLSPVVEVLDYSENEAGEFKPANRWENE